MSLTAADHIRLRQRLLTDPDVAEGGRFLLPRKGGATVCPAGHETDVLGNCLGPCAGEEWD